MNFRFSTEGRLFAALCAADMVSTVWLVATGKAIEANPVMGYYISHGILPFIFAKSLLFVGPVFALEVIRQRKPAFIKMLFRAGITGYVLIYLIGSFKVNSL